MNLKKLNESLDRVKSVLCENINTMLRSYSETALWSSNDNDGNPLDDNYTIYDITKDTQNEFKKDLELFVKKAGGLLDGLDDAQVAHDFWLTRNGHGAGFWDGDYEKDIGERLAKISEEFGEVNLFVNDDGQVEVG